MWRREEEIPDGVDRKKSEEKEADGLTDTVNRKTRKVRRECVDMCIYTQNKKVVGKLTQERESQ